MNRFSRAIRSIALPGLALAWLLPASADPLNISFSDPVPQPTYLGLAATFPIHVEPTVTAATVNVSAAYIGGGIPGTLGLQLDLVAHDCPGTMTEVGGLIEWTGMGDISSGNIIDCSVQLRPRAAPRNLDLALRFDCTGCSGDADDRDSASIQSALAGDIEARLAFTTDVQVGTTAGNVIIENIGDAPMEAIQVALFGDPALFAGIVNNGGVGCQFNYSITIDSATWDIPSMDPGEVVSCPFEVPIPAPGSYPLNLLVSAETLEGFQDPWPDNNADSLTFVATEFVVDARFPLNPDANPGDGLCDDGAGNCSLRAAIDEANALPGRQTILLPYQAAGYLLSSMPTALTITDPVILSGVPDPTTGARPWITRGGSTNVSLVRVDTGSTTRTELRNLDLRGNSALQLSVDGAVVRHFEGTLWIRDSKISGGWTSGSGGGVRGTIGLTLDKVEVFDNIASLGGGVAVYGVPNDGMQDASLTAVALRDNQATANGGGLFLLNAATFVDRSSLVGNQAVRGGGLYVSTSADATIRNSTISGNQASLNGGGIYITAGSFNATVQSSTIAYNAAAPGDNNAGDGGGIYMETGPSTTARIRDSILAFNTARTTGGLLGTVVSGNCFGALTSQGYNSINWITNDPECSIALGPNGSDSYDLAPGLAPLETLPNGVGFHRLTRVNNEIDRANPACEDFNGALIERDITNAFRPREGDGNGEALCDRGAHESRPVEIELDTVAEVGTDWQIVASDERGSCATAYCVFSRIPIGSTVTLSPNPGVNTSFDGWGGDCAASGTGPCTLQMPVSRNVSASFSQTLQPLPLSVSVVGSGAVTSSPAGIDCPGTCSAEFLETTVVTLTAKPGPGFELGSWSGACSGNAGCQVTMDQARNVTATFQLSAIPLAIRMQGPGSGRVTSAPAGINCMDDCTVDFPPMTVVELTALPDAGNTFQNWTGACIGMGICSVTLNEATTVGAVWIGDETIFFDGME